MIMASPAPSQDKVTAPYCSWKSPITADIVSDSNKRLRGIAVDGDGRLIWLETRPTESGRGVLVKESEKAGGEPIGISPKEFSVRTIAQEYGGGDFKISGHTLLFSNYTDQRLYKQLISSGDPSPVPITPDYGEQVVCHADGMWSIFNLKENRLHGLSGVTLTCLGIKQNFGLAIFQRTGC